MADIHIHTTLNLSGTLTTFSASDMTASHCIQYKKRVKMKKSSSSKELLIDWLVTALNCETYKGLGWSDRQERIFYVKWVHKSSEQWSGDDLEPFTAWAKHKGKLDGKNPKQLKATFRCALNSKKELKEHSRDRERRYWQFVDPNSREKDKTPKKRRKNAKASKLCPDSTVNTAFNKDVKIAVENELFSHQICLKNEDEMPKPSKLPAFDSISNFQPLTPPDQANENTYTFPDIKFSKEMMNKLGKYSTTPSDVDYKPTDISSITFNNHSHEACTILPPFEIFGSFRTITPPPQKNEVIIIPSEYRPNYTPPPDQNRLTPPQKSYHTSSDSYNHSNTEDAWQPNCWPVQNKQPKALSDFFSSDFIGLYKSSNQELENSNAMDFLDMDQYVPVTNTSVNFQNNSKIVQPSPVNRLSSSNPIQRNHQLERLDDLSFLGDDRFVDIEACRKIIQEIDCTTSIPHYRPHS